MTIKSISVILTLAFLSAACGSDAPQQSSTPAETSPATSPDANATTNLPQETAPLGTEALGAPPPSPANSATPAPNGSAKINPPHGQPGHVCGTPVGAPLDGSAKASTGGSSQSAAKPAISPVPPPSTTGGGAATPAPGTNPPHGQPGHVCGTPVGSPLPKQ